MANSSRVLLESALRARHLDRTLTTALPAFERLDGSAVLPLDVTSLDSCLQGGLPRGQLSEITGPRSSGRTALLLRLVAATTRRGELAALVDTFDRLDVASAAAAAVDLERLLWIRGQALTSTRAAIDARWVPGEDAASGRFSRFDGPCVGLLERTIDRALKALNLVLQARGFGVVAIDLADVPIPALKRIPCSTWLRVQRTIEGSDTACVLLTPEPLARSAGGLTLALGGRTEWAGDAARSQRVAGLTVAVRVVSPRRRLGGDTHVRCSLRS
jgi:hypothetical protein